MSNDDEPELTPPTARRVSGRALVLSAVTCRAAIEGDADNPKAHKFLSKFVDWLEDLGLHEEAELKELDLLRTKVGELPDQCRINATWRGEAIGVLAWALGASELPNYDESVDSATVAESLGFMSDEASRFLATAELRSSAEINQLAERYFSLHWRLRQFSEGQKSMDFVTFARECWFGPLETNGLSFANRDLAINGKSLIDTDEKTWGYVLSIVRERQQAANWLVGTEKIYSQVTCDT